MFDGLFLRTNASVLWKRPWLSPSRKTCTQKWCQLFGNALWWNKTTWLQTKAYYWSFATCPTCGPWHFSKFPRVCFASPVKSQQGALPVLLCIHRKSFPWWRCPAWPHCEKRVPLVSKLCLHLNLVMRARNQSPKMTANQNQVLAATLLRVSPSHLQLFTSESYTALSSHIPRASLSADTMAVYNDAGFLSALRCRGDKYHLKK